jgi:hypothetical protein
LEGGVGEVLKWISCCFLNLCVQLGRPFGYGLELLLVVNFSQIFLKIGKDKVDRKKPKVGTTAFKKGFSI